MCSIKSVQESNLQLLHKPSLRINDILDSWSIIMSHDMLDVTIQYLCSGAHYLDMNQIV